MYFKRLFGSGVNPINKAEPRNKIWAEFHCNICGEDSEIDVTRSMNTFDFKRERSCPHCGMVDSSDRESNLKAMLDKLTASKNKIEIEIEQIERELNEVQKVSVNNG